MILYEAVAGKLPFVAKTITELAVKVVMDEPEPLTGVDPAYAAIVTRCLEKHPARGSRTSASSRPRSHRSAARRRRPRR